jgi:hypothetical protein
MSHGGGGRGGGLKSPEKCHVLFEWPKFFIELSVLNHVCVIIATISSKFSIEENYWFFSQLIHYSDSVLEGMNLLPISLLTYDLFFSDVKLSYNRNFC